LSNINNPISKRSFRPDQRVCPVCHCILRRNHIQWRKQLLFSNGPEQITSWAYCCPDPNCSGAKQFFVSAEAEALHVPYRHASRELVVKVGYRRFWLHQTMYELHDWLNQDLHLDISERQILNLIGDFLALLRAAQPSKIRHQLSELKQIIIAVDGMQPEKGNTSLYIVREVQTGITLLAENLEDSAHPVLIERIFEPLKELAQGLNLTWQGIVSDAQRSIRIAIAQSLPDVPYQVCQFHALRDAGERLFESDRGLKIHLKSAFRGHLGRMEKKIRDLPNSDPRREILSDYALAIHATLLEGGTAPFELGGIRVFEAMEEIANSLVKCQKKGLIPFWAAC
jgi:hypothetical protein